MSDVLAVVGKISDRWQQRIRESRPDLTVLFYANPKDLEHHCDPRITILAAGGGRATRNLCKKLPRLRWLQTFSAGVDGVVDALPSHIIIASMKGLNQIAVAQHAMAFILALTRLTPNPASTPHAEQVPLRTLEGMVHLIIGYGHIGQQIGEYSGHFGMTVLGISRTPRPDQNVFAWSQLDQKIGTADVITLACPLTPSTTRLINHERLLHMKSGALLINIARGAVVDQDALLTSLARGHLGGAGLDVTTPEPLPEDHPLLQLPNVLVTPHVAGNLPDYMDRAAAWLIDNLERDRDGRPLQNLVNRADGY